MPETFKYDVFLSHSSKDKDIVRPLADRLRKDGLRIWFDEWEIKPGDSIPARIEDGLENSRVLLLCISANAFGSDWAQLESQTFRFRDPLNKERRFIPARLDEVPMKGSLAQFLYVNWLPEVRDQEYSKLLDACQTSAESHAEGSTTSEQNITETIIPLDYNVRVNACAFNADGTRAVTAGADNTARLWDLATGRCLRVLKEHTGEVLTAAWSSDERLAISGSDDWTLRLWNVETGRCLIKLKGHEGPVFRVALSRDQRYALSCSFDKTVRLWTLATGRCRILKGHTNAVFGVAWSTDQHLALSGSVDGTLRLWNLDTGRCLNIFKGHSDAVTWVEFSGDQRYALSGSWDNTVRLWDTTTGRCLQILEGHTDTVIRIAWSADQRHALSGAMDSTIRLWEIATGRCLCVLEGHNKGIRGMAWFGDQRQAVSGDTTGQIRVWNLSPFLTEAPSSEIASSGSHRLIDQVQYTNAKVLLVGETGVGKTGLSKVLAGQMWQPSDSTVGAWATQWKLPLLEADGVEREVWLWDFGGQADQRLIHQLYMEETALAVLVFDGQKEDVIETLGQWDRDLTRASAKPFSKLLVAGRIDAGGLRISRRQIEAFVHERGFESFLETSAKANIGCSQLREAIIRGIRWADIPWRSSPRLFKRLKEEIIRFKDDGRVLMRINELSDALRLRLTGDEAHFNNDELKAVVGLLAGPGVVWELAFGSWVLLQPERINAYAQAVIQTIREDKGERGCVFEERVLNGDLTYRSSIERLKSDEERFVLLAMHQTLVERGLCMREYTEEGPLLIFPSFYRRERPELGGHPAVLVSYFFSGFLDDVYATLIVLLHHTKSFRQDQLWRYAADFSTLTGKQLGVKLIRKAEGSGELEVYFDPIIPIEEKIIFSRYVHEHLLQKGQNVVRIRHYICPHCGTPVGNREVAMRRLEDWLEKKATAQKIPVWLRKPGAPTIICSQCEKRVFLWDDLEQCFASPEMQQRVQELQEQSATVLDNEGKERALVGEIVSTVALAGQICREFSFSDHSIDAEIELRDDNGNATGKKLYLQLESGRYTRERDPKIRRKHGLDDQDEIYTIKDWRKAYYCMGQDFPVMLVVRTVAGELQWMELREWFKRESENGTKVVKQIVFKGERLDVMSVRRWRERVLGRSLAASG